MRKYDELLVSLRRVIRAIDLYSKKLNKESGLTSPQLIVMQEIANNEDVMVKDIATHINLSSATVTSILDRLEARGYVVRERTQVDKRKVAVRLTESGTNAFKNAPTLLQEHFINRFEALDEWEQTQLVSTMQRIAKMMDAEALDAAPLLQVGQIHPQSTVIDNSK
ncbi:MarR family winged helix-turn-helix transcriptional regulator [Paraglaciecola polaris]|uniref:HTH-type transcriptional regulator sarZ n=1 Tax=Paraglaciecola polaris LMG 21857 TaxID=1129793 RepID=K7A9P0_9ALTE|nr:MarR family winged helix-turn-helix transcriptional regulator [Paraglaciecola polaris]GAC32120.1 HTH-type transcriptional regulator sarZ [Paraglaciecola polaris LMG 21857]|tara:strand:+ start:1475 stop:1972 length:498 start_codon:yes stop_codon:yes gene_type:complete